MSDGDARISLFPGADPQTQALSQEPVRGKGCSLQTSEERRSRGGTWTGRLAQAATCPSRPRPSELPGEFPGGRFCLNRVRLHLTSPTGSLAAPRGLQMTGVQGLPMDRDRGGWYEVCSVQGSTAVGAFGAGGKRTVGQAPWGGDGWDVRGSGAGRCPGGHRRRNPQALPELLNFGLRKISHHREIRVEAMALAVSCAK